MQKSLNVLQFEMDEVLAKLAESINKEFVNKGVVSGRGQTEECPTDSSFLSSCIVLWQPTFHPASYHLRQSPPWDLPVAASSQLEVRAPLFLASEATICAFLFIVTQVSYLFLPKNVFIINPRIVLSPDVWNVFPGMYFSSHYYYT